MTMRFIRLLPAIVALSLAGNAAGAEPPIIAKARAYIGSEAALNSLKSVHYVGALVTVDPSDAKKQTRAEMEIIFQKPEQQRITARFDQKIEVTALDGYDGWQRVTETGDKTQWKQTLLGTDHVRRLRANTWENLSFFRGIERAGGRVDDLGTVAVDGVNCQKLAFVHAPKIVFFRYFDVATGRLVMTETESGGTIREQGEMVVNGIRFPKSIVHATKNEAGEVQTVTITFEKVLVNQAFPPEMFSVPSLLSN
jgi:hypothetical protein